MRHRFSLVAMALTTLCWFASSAEVSKRVPGELSRMHDFLTQDEPGKCRNYHYNPQRAEELFELRLVGDTCYVDWKGRRAREKHDLSRAHESRVGLAKHPVARLPRLDVIRTSQPVTEYLERTG